MRSPLPVREKESRILESMNTFSAVPEDSAKSDGTKRNLSLMILFVVAIVAMTLPLPLILLGRPADALAVIYFFPSVFFMGLIRATAQNGQVMKILWRVAGLALSVGFVFIFANALPNNALTVTLAVAGLILCLVFELIAPSSVMKKQVF